MTIEGKPGFQAQEVPCSQAARDGAGSVQEIPKLQCIGRTAVQFKAVLPGVAGPGYQNIQAADINGSGMTVVVKFLRD